MDHKEKLDRMTAQLREDCLYFGQSEADFQHIEEDILITWQSDNDYYYYYDDRLGYVLTFWERGYCNWGINSPDEKEFRFLFQQHIILQDFRFQPESEAFMTRAFPIFGTTEAYRKAREELDRKFRK